MAEAATHVPRPGCGMQLLQTGIKNITDRCVCKVPHGTAVRRRWGDVILHRGMHDDQRRTVMALNYHA